MTRRPLRSAEIETIGWFELPRLLRRTIPQTVEHIVRIAPCWTTWLMRRRRLDWVPNAQQLLLPPQTPWSRAVGNHVKWIGMDDRWIGHSRRTWRFASALADQDPNVHLDPELLYVGSMLHDSGLFDRDVSKCFAVKGADHAMVTAEEAGVAYGRAKIVADAIASHISVAPDNALGLYLQYGSLLDLAGTRLWKLDRDLVDRICLADTRVGLPKDARQRWQTECARFPHGRAAYARRPGGLILATRVAPLPS